MRKRPHEIIASTVGLVAAVAVAVSLMLPWERVSAWGSDSVHMAPSLYNLRSPLSVVLFGWAGIVSLVVIGLSVARLRAPGRRVWIMPVLLASAGASLYLAKATRLWGLMFIPESSRVPAIGQEIADLGIVPCLAGVVAWVVAMWVGRRDALVAEDVGPRVTRSPIPVAVGGLLLLTATSFLMSLVRPWDVTGYPPIEAASGATIILEPHGHSIPGEGSSYAGAVVLAAGTAAAVFLLAIGVGALFRRPRSVALAASLAAVVGGAAVIGRVLRDPTRLHSARQWLEAGMGMWWNAACVVLAIVSVTLCMWVARRMRSTSAPEGAGFEKASRVSRRWGRTMLVPQMRATRC